MTHSIPVEDTPPELPIDKLRGVIEDVKEKIRVLKLEEFRNEHLKIYQESLLALKSIDRSLLEPYEKYVPPLDEKVETVDTEYI